MTTETMNSTNQKHVPVLIVGAGGAGLSMSLLLQQQGIKSLLIERRAEISWVPRARNLNFRTLEVFRGLGLEAEVVKAGTRVSRMFSKETLASNEQEDILDAATLVENIEELTPGPFLWYCPQNQLEPLLLSKTKQRGAKVQYNTELVSFTQDQNGVTATIKDRSTGKIFEQHSDYLVAADGAHSPVRTRLNIPTKGLGAIPEQYIFVYFRANWAELVHDHMADGIIIKNSDGMGMFLITDMDRGMYMIICPPNDQRSPQDYTKELCKDIIIKAMGKREISVEIIEVAPWQPIQRVADEFQVGRVFLVGDAAHTMPPKLGLGVNTAIQSAQNLAWKLVSVLKGNAGSQLLTTYQEERHPVGLLVADQSLTGPATELLDKMSANISELPKKQLSLLRIIVGYPYRSEAIISEEYTPLSPDDFPDRPELSGLPGTRLTHIWVEQKGKRISTLDLFDGRIVLLTGSNGSSWCEAAKTMASKMGIDLAAYRVGGDGDLIDKENGWQTKMRMPDNGAMLVRPDGYVAWRSMTMPANPAEQLESALVHILSVKV